MFWWCHSVNSLIWECSSLVVVCPSCSLCGLLWILLFCFIYYLFRSYFDCRVLICGTKNAGAQGMGAGANKALHLLEELFFTTTGRLAYVFARSQQPCPMWLPVTCEGWVENALMVLLISRGSLQQPGGSPPNVTSRSPANRALCSPVIYGQSGPECIMHHSEEGFSLARHVKGCLYHLILRESYFILSEIFTWG